jgi:hypothetical protein
VIAGAGDTIYTTGITEQHKDWQLFRAGKPLLDPDTQEVLGHEAVFLGTARQTRSGVPASFLVTTSKLEIVRDDRLLPAPRRDVPSYVPRAPTKQIRAKVINIYSGVNFGGAQSVITINRGRAGSDQSLSGRKDGVPDSRCTQRPALRVPRLRPGLLRPGHECDPSDGGGRHGPHSLTAS